MYQVPTGSQSTLLSILLLITLTFANSKINRKSIVQTHNLRLNASHPYSPIQLGNGNFAFDTDVTGLQTFVPHSTLSSWGQTRPEDFTGQWLISNPHRINLGRIGLGLGERGKFLDLWSGISTSELTYNSQKVVATTAVHPDSDTVGMEITSELVKKGELGNKIDAQFRGVEKGSSASIQRESKDRHKYVLSPGKGDDTLSFTTTFASERVSTKATFNRVRVAAATWWFTYWNTGAFISIPKSGLVNNGWYGKFHLEISIRPLHRLLQPFLISSIERAAKQGYKGARFGKMSDPSGRSAPEEINSLLIWQQGHPMYFADIKWEDVLTATADFMASYAWWNVNPTFELAYWRFGLDVASKWKKRQGKKVPEEWTKVYDNIAPFQIENGVHVTYEGIPDMWNTPSYTEDHQGLLGIYGWLPPDPQRLSLPTFQATLEKVYETWNFTYSYGWNFPLLAMAAARTGGADKAVDWLLTPSFVLDEVDMPVNGARVATPYFPASSGLLLAVGMISGGWDRLEGPVWPKKWDVRGKGF
ncbi:hypothetical protein GQ43DRAFT_455576 [Delitschia confertaspora ATCC 74209]|uniref:Uncharacterized protein n=1 Tax=Delitschia confertaspora ATCC 74209 TaxID=1513339 RepID=A0A9P4MZB6_9PLEO|nr:hypothetical protein GQ43DRAFT_455576 [Delitschia confertaspora ATCC 74209]